KQNMKVKVEYLGVQANRFNLPNLEVTEDETKAFYESIKKIISKMKCVNLLTFFSRLRRMQTIPFMFLKNLNALGVVWKTEKNLTI
ncbi:MAG: hypothetical protein K8R79_02430, partial [Calditrichales bacterium]|nr:hypothetical protein [Calditrichales bacterium]